MFSNIIDLLTLLVCWYRFWVDKHSISLCSPFPDLMSSNMKTCLIWEQTPAVAKREEQYQFHMNGITKDEGRNTRSILFVLPGWICLH
jgi:hypothetical protein